MVGTHKQEERGLRRNRWRTLPIMSRSGEVMRCPPASRVGHGPQRLTTKMLGRRSTRLEKTSIFRNCIFGARFRKASATKESSEDGN
jgi:hypothetical protein